MLATVWFNSFTISSGADKDVYNNQYYETNNSIQVASSVKENDGHYPEYVPFKNKLFPPSNAANKSLSDQEHLKQNNYFPTPISVNRYMVNSPEYKPLNQVLSF